MKLYYAPGACSLSPHIAMREAGIPVQLVSVDLAARKTEEGNDFKAINSKGYVPTLELPDGQRLTEGPAIVQYLADQKPDSGLAPRNGTVERYRLQEWLNFITSELHKSFGALFQPTTPEDYKPIARDNVANRFAFVDQQLGRGGPYLMGNQFTVADAYMYVMCTWAGFMKMDLGQWSNLKSYAARIAERPKVQETLREEGLAK